MRPIPYGFKFFHLYWLLFLIVMMKMLDRRTLFELLVLECSVQLLEELPRRPENRECEHASVCYLSPFPLYCPELQSMGWHHSGWVFPFLLTLLGNALTDRHTQRCAHWSPKWPYIQSSWQWELTVTRSYTLGYPRDGNTAQLALDQWVFFWRVFYNRWNILTDFSCLMWWD